MVSTTGCGPVSSGSNPGLGTILLLTLTTLRGGFLLTKILLSVINAYERNKLEYCQASTY